MTKARTCINCLYGLGCPVARKMIDKYGESHGPSEPCEGFESGPWGEGQPSKHFYAKQGPKLFSADSLWHILRSMVQDVEGNWRNRREGIYETVQLDFPYQKREWVEIEQNLEGIWGWYTTTGEVRTERAGIFHSRNEAMDYVLAHLSELEVEEETLGDD